MAAAHRTSLPPSGGAGRRGLLDVFDGSVARARGEASRWGAFLDSTLDRIADVIVFGALFWSLPSRAIGRRRRSR
jgi:phosphatidylglycerophosphate synthase